MRSSTNLVSHFYYFIIDFRSFSRFKRKDKIEKKMQPRAWFGPTRNFGLVGGVAQLRKPAQFGPPGAGHAFYREALVFIINIADTIGTILFSLSPLV